MKGSRNRLPTDERRAQLLELGLRLFGERSYEDISIEDIARAAGISKGLLYHYFGGKRAFYVACVQQAATRLIEATTPQNTDRTDNPARAKEGLEAYLNFVQERDQAYLALMHGGIGADKEVQNILHEARRTIVDRILQEMGLDPPPPAFRLAAQSWLGAVEAACLDWLTHRDVPRDGLVQMLQTSLAASMLAAFKLAPDTPIELEIDPTLFS